MAKLSAMTAFILLSSVRSIRTDTGDSSFISVTGCAESLVIDFLTTLSHSYQLQHLTAREKVERTPTLSNTKRHSSHCETVYTYRNSTQNFKYERVFTVRCSSGGKKIQLRGRHIKVTAFLLEPYVIMKDGIPVGGYFYQLLANSANYYNFTYDLELPAFKGTVQLPNGTFLGPMGDVISGRKDLVLGSAQTLERIKYLDFPTYADFGEIGFVTSHPQRVLRSDAILLIFPPSVWLLLSFSCCMNLCIFYMFTRWQRTVGNDVRSRHVISAAWWPAFIAILCPILEQGSRANPPTSARRFVLFLWLFSSITLVAFYKTDLIAYLTLPEMELIPSTFKELSENPSYNIQFMFLNAAGTVFFNRTRNPEYVKLRERFIWQKDKLKCLESAAFQPKTICIAFDMITIPVVARNMTLRRDFDPYTHSKDAAFSVVTNMGFNKGSKFVGSFNQIVGFLRDTGNIWKWKNDAYDIRRTEGSLWLNSEGSQMRQRLKDLINNQEDGGVEPLRIANIVAGIVVLAAGLLVASFYFGSEIIKGRSEPHSMMRSICIGER